jgi:hypothetical protein
VVSRRVAEAGVDAVQLLRRLLQELDAAALQLLVAGLDVVRGEEEAAPAGGVGLQDAGRHPHAGDRRRMRGAVGGRRRSVQPAEARREGADAPEADQEGDVGDGAVGVAQESGRALQPAREQVPVGRLAERAAELTAEVGGRQMGDAGEGGHVERLAVAGVDQVLRPEQVPQQMDVAHRN